MTTDAGPLAGLPRLSRGIASGGWELERFGISDAAVRVACPEPMTSPTSRVAAKADDPGFVLPQGQRRFGQAFRRNKPGPTAAEVNASVRAFAPAAWAGNVSLVKTNPLNPPTASTEFAVAAYSFGGLHELVGTGLNFHALAASLKKRDRYGRQLDAMLAADVAKFNGGRDSGGGLLPHARGTPGRPLGDQADEPPATDGRRLDTLILQRENASAAGGAAGGRALHGKFIYDMDKVEKLAAMDDTGQPERMKQAIANARNVFLTAHIKNEIATKRAQRALYDGVRNVFGVVGATALAAGTHGTVVPAALAAKQAGYGLLAVGALDPANMARGYKQRFRNEKAKQVEDGTLARLEPYLKNFGLHPAIIESAEKNDADSARCKQLVSLYQAARDPDSAIDPAAMLLVDHTAAGTRAFNEAAAVRSADKMTFSRLRLKGSLFDHDKNTRAKRDRTELAAKHVARIADHRLDNFCADETLLSRIFLDFAEPANTTAFRTKIDRQRELIKRDPHLRPVYDLFRDVGFGRTDAVMTITGALARRLASRQPLPLSLFPKGIRDDLAAANGRFAQEDIVGIRETIKGQR